MQECYFEAPLTNAQSLCVGPITKAEAIGADADGPFCDGLGYYLFTVDKCAAGDPVRVLAKFVSEAAALSFASALDASGALPRGA